MFQHTTEAINRRKKHKTQKKKVIGPKNVRGYLQYPTKDLLKFILNKYK